MNFGDTSLGGNARSFPVTSWGMVSRLRSEGAVFLEELCRLYWKPVYTYVRVAWSKSNEDAKDLTQAFLLWLIEGGALERYAPERGGFRKFLRMLLDGFVAHREQALHRLKRGGGRRILSADDERISSLPDPRSSDPGEAFDRAWAGEIMARAVDQVRKRFLDEGRGLQFQAFQEYDLKPADSKPTYATIARRLGIRESMARDYIAAAREAIRTEIRAELARTTNHEAELQEEWNALFGA